ncbi:helix-turn-helix domain-containing protein (plasmid) [Streptomyces sp. NBC_00053]|uniref:Multiprotein-bridging factor 1 family protein n=1 Tax=Streptomyces sanglieri TaxID=193460 RepID=A0ABW2WKI5_9ACTN|nr:MULTISPECIES: helix-turn-helix transcriptional regulator [unclassified Streptomyces]WTB60139.1 helix-turn-helix domain-containing protein [Streptomyces sp. NBC_00826]MCX4399982.1 helix-turn-helix domain-containing protein [Streptomyces sp. NBC_01767]MCX5506015.1 helix-turn-helix domain-containing protein [Streptomyces sp. NBC_00052]MCX5554330.1 helix-turn-helix domain-containing protein [Streptomyces sp. NBC_00051]WTB60664.1 helix-turn-helix domain-containing protein [Streptomyces sp. NBC_0
MPTPDERSTADRIREQRKRARLSQRELSARIPYSYSLLNQVECGARVATADFTAAVAAALGIDITTLTGPPHVTEMQHGLLASLVRPIRESLALYDLAPDGNMPARPTDKLVHEADRLCQEVRATHLRKAARALPGVINDLTLAAHTVPTTEAWRALASTYRTAHDIAIKLGFPDLAIVALDRMGWAAEHASDPCLAAIRQYRRALGHAEAEQCLGRRLVAAGQELVADQTTREGLAVAGQLHLGASAVAARAGDTNAVEQHIAAARELADRVGGEAREVHWLSFGQMNVTLHEMGAAIAMRQFDDALRQARAVRLPPATLTSRRARFLVDRAVVEMETGHLDASLRHLVAARRAAPEQTRYHPRTRETVTGLLHTSRRTSDPLANMATWIGL